jgi:hypothetical protein
MKELVQLAKSVITRALFDCVVIRSGKSKTYCGTPYVDETDHFLWSKINPNNINKDIVKWFESNSRAPLSYLYWMDYAGFNPNPINCYIKKLRAILDGEHLQDEKKIEIDRYAEPELHYIAKGYLPYANLTQHGKKWMNI